MFRRLMVPVGVLWFLCNTAFIGAVPPVGEPSPGWLTWSMNLDASPPPRNSGLSQIEFDELRQTIERIGALYRETPYLQQPPGVEIVPSRVILPRVAGEGPVRAEFSLNIYRPVRHHRNPSSYFRLQINDPWMEGGLVFEDDQGGIYLEQPSLEPRNGKLRYQVDRNTVIEKILPPGREPWIAVSQERWIRLLIEKTERELRQYQEQLAGEASERRRRAMQHYESSMSMASIYRNEPHRFPGMDAAMREELAANIVRAAEASMQTFEQNERIYREIASAIAAGDFDALEAAGDRGRAMMGRHMLSLREELAGLSATQRAAPAYGFEYDPAMYWMPRRTPRRPSLLLDAGDRNARALLAPNPDFFRRDLPAGQIQSITILNRLWPEFDERLEQELDWRAMAAMVR